MAHDPTRTETVTAADGGAFDLWVWLPESGSGPGVLVLQEIFGVGDFIRERCASLAAEGFVAAAPDVFWRTERHVDHGHDEAGLEAAFASVTRWGAEVDDETKTSDLVASLDHLRDLDEVDGGVAVMGYCLGGRLTYETAVAGEPDCAVSYYGSGIGERLDAADGITCPILFQYGGDDPYIPSSEIEAVRQAFAGRADARVEVEADAGHAFENHSASMFHQPDAAARSWPRTLAFLREHLG